MTDKRLRHLSRAELLEMLVQYAEENEALKQQLEEAQKQLEDRTIAIKKAGTMAEAAMQLNGVFEAADKAIQQYLENIIHRISPKNGDGE